MVALRNVNLRSRPGRYHVHYTMSGRRFLATEDRKDSAAGPLQRMYSMESSAEASAQCSDSEKE